MTTSNGYLGLDPASSEGKPCGWAALGDRAELLDVGGVGSDADIMLLADRWRPRAVAIDAPLSLPRGLCCLEEDCPCSAVGGLKAAERELFRQGISLYATTKRSIIKHMIRRAMDLRRAFEERGYVVLEVYPYAAKVRLWGKGMPKKTTSAGRQWLRERLEGIVPGLELAPRLTHDQLDAIVAAYTAYLYGCGKAEGVGDPDEGLIWVPRAVTLS